MQKSITQSSNACYGGAFDLRAMGEIANFFEGKTLLLAGGTGYLGKALIERLLWQLPQIRRLVLLVRPHSVQHPEIAARVRTGQAIFRSSVFDRLRVRHGERFYDFIADKVKIVAGDLSRPDLALDLHSLQMLASEVDVIINVAACVNFHERLDRAVFSNTLGPSNLLNLAKQCRNCKMLHVSTAYVCGRRSGCIPEDVLQPDVSAFDLMEIGCNEPFCTQDEVEKAVLLAQSVERESRTPEASSEFRHVAIGQLGSSRSVDKVDAVAEKNRQLWVDDVLSKEGVSRARRFGWIDTYTFTKALGEQLLLQSNDGVPTIILRPSVIESSLYHPEPGWIEGYRMTSPILFGYGKGTLPDFPARPDGVIDIIPIDFVVSALLASLTIPECGNPSVFQVASGYDNPLRWKELMEYTDAYFHAMPLHTPSGPIVPRAWKYRGSDEFNAWLQRHRRMVDFALKACNSVDFWPGALRLARKLKRKQRFFRRMEDMTRVYGDYTQLVCCFDTKNTRRLFQSLPRGDQQKFFFDPSVIDWPTYIREVQLPGVRRHVIRDAAQQRRGLARVVLQPQLNDRMPGTLETKEFG